MATASGYRVTTVDRRGWALPLGTALVCGLAVAVRLSRVDETQITNDEAFSWRITGYPADELVRRVADDANPPLYYLVLKAWVAACGDSLTAMRGLSALFAGLTVAAVVGFVAELAGRRGRGAGLLAGLLVAAHPLQVDLGRAARGYTLGTFVAVASSWLLWRGLHDRRIGWWVGYGLAAAAFAYTHHYAAFTLAAHAAFVLGWAALAAVRGRPGVWKVLVRAVLAGALAAVLYVPWLTSTLRQAHSVQQGFWIKPVTAAGLADKAVLFTAGQQADGGVAFGLAAALGGAVVVGLAARRDAAGAFLLAGVLAPWACAVAGSYLLGRSILVDRYLAFAQLFYLSGLALVAWRLPGRAAGVAAAGLVVAVFAEATGRALDDPRRSGHNLEALAGCVAGRAAPGEVVLSPVAGEALQVQYYVSRAGSHAAVRPVGWPVRAGAAHQPHAAAYRDDEWVAPDELARWPAPTVLVAEMTGRGFPYPDEWHARSSDRFFDGKSYGWVLVEAATAPDRPSGGGRP